MQIEFYKEYGAEYVRMRDGRKLFNEKIHVRSPNGQYAAVSGYWYIDDLDNDEAEDNGDEIEGSESLYVLNGNQIFKKIKGLGYCPDDFIIKDNGFFAYITDEGALVVYNQEGKRTIKKLDYTIYEQGINEYGAWFLYEDDQLNQKVNVVHFDSLKSWTKQMNEDVGYAFFALILQSGGVVVLASDYREQILLLFYNCNASELTESNLTTLQRAMDEYRRLHPVEESDISATEIFETSPIHKEPVIPESASNSQSFTLLDKKASDKQKTRKGFFSNLFRR